ncbi:MAG: tellurium resistance protein [Marinosulfonomonas sp.]|nr:tellurium resistance protein [Marinosulfonomonas sp.]
MSKIGSPAQPAPGLFRQTPPAIFPPILGLFGLGLAWRRAAEVFGAPTDLAEIILGAVSLLFVFCVLAYLAKLVRDGGVFLRDLKILPGRSGLSGASAAALLFAATLIPYGDTVAKVVLLLGLVAHSAVAFAVVYVLAPAPLPQRRITPVWHLTFVGFIVAPLAAIPLGAEQMSELIMFVTMPLAATIWIGHLVVSWRSGVPAPLRPALSIHLAPLCLFGIVGSMLGYTVLAQVFGWLAVILIAILTLRVRYLTQSGFSPFWGAFTFPVAAFANLMLILSPDNGLFRILGAVSLVAASIIVPIIAYRIMKLWSTGKLAVITNAARI